MTKSKIQPMIISALFELTIDIEPEMNILKVVLTGKCAKIIYKEYSQGLKTTLNHMLKALDRIGFIYLNTYYGEICKELNNNSIYISDEDHDFEVLCCYDSENKISIFDIKIDGWLK